MAYKKVVVPQAGEKIQLKDGKLHVPDNPIVCFYRRRRHGRRYLGRQPTGA